MPLDHLFQPGNLHPEACIRCGRLSKEHPQPIPTKIDISPLAFLCSHCKASPRSVVVNYGRDIEKNTVWISTITVICYNFHYTTVDPQPTL